MFGTMSHPTSTGLVPWPAEAVARYVAKGYWDGRSISDHIYAVAAGTPDAICLVEGGHRLSYRELTTRADGAAVRLRALGLRADDRVVMQLPNCWEFVVLAVACFRLGVIPVMALPAHRQTEISALAAHTEAKALLVPDVVKDFDYREMAGQVAADTPSVRHVMVLGAQPWPDHADLRTICEPADDPSDARALLDVLTPPADAVALFLLSGGTTGTPKLIARTHNDFGFMARRSAAICGVGHDDVYLAALPLAHGFPMSGPGVLGTLMAGGRVVIIGSPAPDRAFAAIERERVTFTSLVPAAIQRWLEYRDAGPAADLSSLRFVQSGGARLPEHLAPLIARMFGGLQQVYGMSEGLLCLTRLDDPPEVVHHTQGRPICVDDEVLLVDENGDPVPPDQPGVLLTRGPYTPRGYYRAPEQNAQAFTADGWYRTGDIVARRPDGNLVIKGREKDVINRGGEKISAEEVELAVVRLTPVQAAAAVAMPDRELGERICLYVVPRPGATVTLAQVRNAMSQAGTAHFKLPERVVPVAGLPTTTVGKVDKKALRADLARRSALDDTAP